MTNNLEPTFDERIPAGDDRIRRVCRHCSFVDYQNPRIVAGAVVVRDGKVLLCKRAIEPRRGYWTLPAGFMELGETVEEAAAREAMEEANARIEIRDLLAVYSVPRIGQVQVMFRADLVSDVSAGPESEAVNLYQWKDIPWRDLAFPTVVWALTHYAGTRNQSAIAPFTNPPGVDALTR